MTAPWNEAALRAVISETDETLKVYIDENHLTYLPVYLRRADALHGLGAAPTEVMRQLWLAARCYADHGKVYLAKWPRHQFRRRRLLPLECALIAGDPKVFETIGQVVGLDTMTLLAGQEPSDLTHEVRVMTRFFGSNRLEDQVDLAGFLAVLYWLAMAAIVDEQTASFEAVRALAGRMRERHPELCGNRAGGLGRMLAIHDVLACVNPVVPDGILDGLAAHHRLHSSGLTAKVEADATLLDTAEGALDTTVLCLLAIAAALGVNLGPALAARSADPDLALALAYAEPLGHTSAA